MIRAAALLLLSLARSVLWTLLALILLAAPARAMSFDAHGDTLYATGGIVPGDTGRLARAIVGRTAIVLDSPGGVIGEAVLMAGLVHAHALRVTVHGRCDSACFLLFVAGSSRSVEPGARVGVHSARSAIDGTENDSAAASTLIMARAAAAYGATPASIGKMVATPPSGIAYLTADDLAGLGVR